VTGFCIVRMNGSVIVISASKCKNPSNDQPAEPNTHDHPCPAESLLGNAMVSNSGTKKRKTAQYCTYNSHKLHKRSSNESKGLPRSKHLQHRHGKIIHKQRTNANIRRSLKTTRPSSHKTHRSAQLTGVFNSSQNSFIRSGVTLLVWSRPSPSKTVKVPSVRTSSQCTKHISSSEQLLSILLRLT
jgi:hypothetical protein